MPTDKRGWPLPEQSTSPPDVVKWLADGLNAADNSFAWGPVGSVPATLAVGQVYFEHEA